MGNLYSAKIIKILKKIQGSIGPFSKSKKKELVFNVNVNKWVSFHSEKYEATKIILQSFEENLFVVFEYRRSNPHDFA